MHIIGLNGVILQWFRSCIPVVKHQKEKSSHGKQYSLDKNKAAMKTIFASCMREEPDLNNCCKKQFPGLPCCA